MRSYLLKEVCNIEMGQSPKGSSYNEENVGLPLLGGASDLGEVYPQAKKFTTEPSKITKKGDLILCIRATIGDRNWANREYCLGRGVAGLRPKKDVLDSRYLWHWLEVGKDQLLQQANGSTFKQVTRDAIGSCLIPLPPIAEQKRIAAILDKADAIRRKRQEAIKLTEELGRSLFLDMFGDLTKFQKIKIEKVASKEKHALSSGPFGSNLTSKDYVDYGVLVLRGKNITQGELDLSDSKYISHGKANSLSRSIVKSGDIVVVAVGSSGFSFTIPEGFPKAVMSQNFNKITPDINKINPVYFLFILNSCFVQNQLKQNITDTVRTFLSLTKLKRIEIPLPDINLQNSFAKKIATINKLKKIEERNLQESENLFNSLLQRAFKGEL